MLFLNSPLVLARPLPDIFLVLLTATLWCYSSPVASIPFVYDSPRKISVSNTTPTSSKVLLFTTSETTHLCSDRIPLSSKLPFLFIILSWVLYCSLILTRWPSFFFIHFNFLFLLISLTICPEQGIGLECFFFLSLFITLPLLFTQLCRVFVKLFFYC